MDVYEETPPMSTYILSFIVCDFDNISYVDKKGRIFRMWSRRNATKFLNYGLNATVNILNGYEEYFNFPYPLKKLDSIAIPGLTTAAIENFGCIIYSEENLALDEEDTFIENQKFITGVIAHEVAHQVGLA